MQTAVQASAAQPRLGAFPGTLTGRALLAVTGSLFVAAAAHISVPLPFTPVPLTFSDLAVLLVGLAFGPGTAFAALALYLAEGAAGLPVFSPFGGAPGILRFYGTSAGYLFAYPFAAALASFLVRRFRAFPSRFAAALAAVIPASALIMVAGTAWLGLLLHLTPARAFLLGAAPFLPGQAIKVLAAAGISSALSRRTQA